MPLKLPPKSCTSSQATISSFFKRKEPIEPSSSRPQAAASSSSIINGDASPRSGKRTKLDADVAEEQRTRNRVASWRFDASAPRSQSEEAAPSASQRTPAEEARHQAFRRKLVGPDNFLTRSVERAARMEELEGGGPPSDGMGAMDVDEEAGALAEEIDDDDAGEGPSTNAFSQYASSSKVTPVAGKSSTNKQNGKASVRTSSDKGKGKGKGKATGEEGVLYTPLEKQIMALKEEHPGVLLIIEVGYKLKFYGEDARIASRELNIMCFPEKHLLAAMIPVHRLHVHIKKLISAGHKVGVVRQIETRALKAASSNSNTPFVRKLTALYTSSTWVDELDSLDSLGPGFGSPAASNSLISIVERLEGGSGPDERVSIGLVSVQVSTGAITYDQFSDGHMRSELETRLAHLQPAELLLPSDLSKPTEKMLRYLASQTTTAHGENIRVERMEKTSSYNEAFSAVSSFYEKELFGWSSDGESSTTTSAIDKGELLSVVVTLPHLVIIALAALTRHLKEFGLASIFRLTKFFSPFSSRASMLLNGNTLENLEIYRNSTDFRERGSLVWILDRCKTTMGRRLLRKWIGRPLTDVEALRARVDAVQELVDGSLSSLNKLSPLLSGLPDLEKGLARLNYGRASPSELAQILLAFDRITREFPAVDSADQVGCRSRVLNEAIASLPRSHAVVKECLSAISLKEAHVNNKADLYVDPEKYPKLEDSKDCIAIVEHELHEHLLELRKLLKRPALEYISVSGIEYLVEVRQADAKKVPADWIRINSSKAMVRFHTPTIIKKTKERDQHRERLAAEADLAFLSFTRDMSEHYAILRNTVSNLATLDCLLSLAAVANLPGFCKPTFNDRGKVTIKGGRHPMSEALRDEPFVPNDVELGGDQERAWLLTGSNMGGKSSLVRMIALLCVMAQVGSYVPADSADLCIHDAVLTRMGASDELAKGRSTFMVEVAETCDILKTATERSLVILDELGRGTSTHDGVAIAHAVLTHLLLQRTHSPKLLFVTHYFALGTVAERSAGTLRNMHMGFVQEERPDGSMNVISLYKVRPGLANKSHGIECARLAGLPGELLVVAREKAEELERVSEDRARRSKARRMETIVRVLVAPDAVLRDASLDLLRVLIDTTL